MNQQHLSLHSIIDFALARPAHSVAVRRSGAHKGIRLANHNMNITRLTNLARTKARHKAHKHAVMVTRGGAIVSFGTNHDEVHAEVAALKQLWPSERRGTKIVSIRLRRSGTLGMAKPCPECQEFMRQNGVKSVMYTNRQGDWETMRL